jgi:hypothetical protein
MKAKKELSCGTRFFTIMVAIAMIAVEVMSRFFAIMVAIAMIAVEVMTSSNLVISDNREESNS